jgi:hypothetical protein
MKRLVTVEKGNNNTVKLTRQPRAGKLTGTVSVIMFDHEIPDGDVESLRGEFQADWKVAVRKYDLIVDLG